MIQSFLSKSTACQKHRFKHFNFQYIYLISYKIAKKANPRKWNCPIENRRYAIRAKISDISQDFRVNDIFIRKDAIQVLKAVFGGG